MKCAAWLALCFGMVLGMPMRLTASDNLVELILLFDAAQLQERGERWQAAEFGRDLVDNLPARIGVQVFHFGDGPGLARLPVDSLTAEGLGGVTIGGPSGMSLQQALIAAEENLCRPIKADGSTGTVIVLVGGSGENESFALSGSCRVRVYTISAESESDPALRQLAERTHGRYYSLATARGFTVATDIKERVWAPVVAIETNRIGNEAGETPDRRRDLYSLLSISVLLAFWVWQRRVWRLRHPRTRPAESRPSGFEEPAYEANLKICSAKGLGSVFPVSSRELVILGGKQYSSTSSAQLLLPDPMVAEEHCQIYAQAGTFFVEDLGSVLGTFVNHEKVLNPAPLSSGDVLEIGETMLEFSIST